MGSSYLRKSSQQQINEYFRAVWLPVALENPALVISTLFLVVPVLSVCRGTNVLKICDSCDTLGCLVMTVGRGHKVRCKLHTCKKKLDFVAKLQ